MPKKNRISLALACILAAFCAMNVSAKERQYDRPKDGQVVLVGRMTLKHDINREFYERSFGVTPGTPHEYFVGMRGPWENGEFFFLTVRRPRNDSFRLHDCCYLFFRSKFGMKSIPFDITFPIPDKVDYMYVGTFIVDFSKDDFIVNDITCVDEYDLAKENVLRYYGKNATVYRAIITQTKEITKGEKK